ncbi:MAG: hypothetical protein UW86_C0003G0014 [Microgenomates group bacterium GW2011_GWA1_Microgenomates_45_10]|nr:MAG: hypothetical protein UW69_C0034G0004 [Microgenomates group bacterium GW2011_GWA2_44_7]KKT77646.1 MAG: hypothetical protein UW73_C0015G0014 [Microgenomates group bacterium GW2011_GWB1_44_8]KKT87369.1 MAG: hypothetical protein UW86_C0003G0014 [Microgenomates group bacterium GW2011_GWA1_Microgenomates_45_10]
MALAEIGNQRTCLPEFNGFRGAIWSGILWFIDYGQLQSRRSLRQFEMQVWQIKDIYEYLEIPAERMGDIFRFPPLEIAGGCTQQRWQIEIGTEVTLTRIQLVKPGERPLASVQTCRHQLGTLNACESLGYARARDIMMVPPADVGRSCQSFFDGPKAALDATQMIEMYQRMVTVLQPDAPSGPITLLDPPSPIRLFPVGT